MIWRVVLSFYFLNSVTGTWIPEMTNKNMVACGNDCLSKTDVKKLLVNILEHMEQNPYDIHILIQELKSQIQQELPISWYNNNREAGVIKSMLWKPHLNTNDSSQCTKAVTLLETATRNAYLHLRKSSCLNLMLPLYEKFHSDMQIKDIETNINMIVVKILKELTSITEKLSSEKPLNTNLKIISQGSEVMNPIIAENTPIRDEKIPLFKPMEEFYKPQIKSVSVLIPKLQRTLEILYSPKQEIQSPSINYAPDSLPIAKSEHLTLEIPQPSMPQEQIRPEVMQDLRTVFLSEVNPTTTNFVLKREESHKPDIIQGFTIPELPSGIMPASQPFEIKSQVYHRPNIMPDLHIPLIGVNPEHITLKPEPQMYNRPDITQDLIISGLKPKAFDIKSLESQGPMMTANINIPVTQPGVTPATKDFKIKYQEYHEPGLFSSNPSELPIIESERKRDVIPDILQSQSVYPNFIAQSLIPITTPRSTYLHPTYVESKVVHEKLPIAPNQPVYVNSQSMYVEPQSLNSNTLKLILQLVKDLSSSNQIDNIETVLNQNRKAFKPQHYKILLKLLQSYKKGIIDSRKINVIFNFLLNPKISIWWNDEKQDILWDLLLFDAEEQINITNIELVLSLINSVKQDPYSKYMLDQLLPLLKLYHEDHKIIDIIFTLLNQNKKKILRPAQIEVLVTFMKSNKKDIQDKCLDIAKTLVRWDEFPYLNSDYVNIIFSLLKPGADGIVDTRVVEIVHKILSVKETNSFTTTDVNNIFTFLKPLTIGKINSKYLDIILFILKNVSREPRLKDIFLKLIGIDIESKYIDMFLSLNREDILNIQLYEALLTLSKQEKTGYIDNYVLNKVFILLEPYKFKHPKIVNEIFNLLRSKKNPIYQSHLSLSGFYTDTNSNQDNLKLWQYKPRNLEIRQNLNTFNVPHVYPSQAHYVWEKYNSNQGQSIQASNWLSLVSQLLQEDQKSIKQLKSLDKNDFIELTFKLNNEKPLTYKPAYYVKYKIPMTDFMLTLSSLNAQYPQYINNPVKLLQNLLIEGYMSEISPNLKGLQKQEILASTLENGDLVQAKVLDKNTWNLNEQIKFAHNLNTKVSPEEILQLNNINSAQYFTNKEYDQPSQSG